MCRPDLTEKLRAAGQIVQIRSAVAACKVALKLAELDHPILADALERLDGGLETGALCQHVQYLADELDEAYLRHHDAVQEGFGSGRERDEAKRKACASQAVACLRQNRPSAVDDSIFEAMQAVEGMGEQKLCLVMEVVERAISDSTS